MLKLIISSLHRAKLCCGPTNPGLFASLGPFLPTHQVQQHKDIWLTCGKKKLKTVQVIILFPDFKFLFFFFFLQYIFHN